MQLSLRFHAIRILPAALLLCAGLWADTLLEIDFIKGKPDDRRINVEGGRWEQGWRVTGNTDRIIIDLQRDVRDGYVEVVVTREGPLEFKERKRNWLGVSGEPGGAPVSGRLCPGGRRAVRVLQGRDLLREPVSHNLREEVRRGAGLDP